MPSPRISKEFPNSVYFLTLTVIEWIDIFTKPQYFKVLVDSLKFCQQHKGLEVYGYVFMTNHIHLMVRTTEPHSLGDILRDYKRFTTKEIKRLLLEDNRKYIMTLLANSYKRKEGSEFQIWQRENYPEMIQSESFLLEKLQYIHQNPVRKEYVDIPEHWIYSSARQYAGISDEATIPIHGIARN